MAMSLACMSLSILLAVGELGKILAPSKRWIVEIHEAGSRNNFGKRFSFMEKGDMKKS
jgi:hypothetical protein